ncbi:MAG TPA: hypothetical protein VIY48_18165 [Candidatus Paceibacterota bacterium]
MYLYLVRETSVRTGVSNVIGLGTTWKAAEILAQSAPGVPILEWRQDESLAAYGWMQSEIYVPIGFTEEFRCFMTIVMLHTTTEAHAKQLLATKEANK